MSLITTVVGPSENSLNQSSTSPPVPSLERILDGITLYLIFSLFLFSLFSLLLILYLRLRSHRRRNRLHSFALHSSSRLLLVSLISLWSLSELLRLPLFRLNLRPSLSLSIPLQTKLCMLHHVISLGLLEPGFLATLLFLLNTSLNNNNNNSYTTNGRFFDGVIFVITFCSPVCIALYLAIYKLPTRAPLPEVFFHSVAYFEDHELGCKVVLCTYPLLTGAVFGVFGVFYSVTLLFKSWQVISLAINKRLASRINVLSFTVLMCLAIQVVLLSLSVFLNPRGAMYYVIVFVIFLSVLVCAIVGEGILVIIPILDALSAGVVIGAKDVHDEEELNE